MIVWIILGAIIVLSFISGWNNPTQNKSNYKSKESDIEPIFDDGEIVGWYEETE